ncbi:double zinc ribbon domain-containing protein [Candidatus Binatus sp.]|uniref:double zinc ribbon domain-containing protein n=1 Tax=Candidatus Binatus sp. TaxID=2811406 RepID=UPI003BB06745
MRYRDTRPLTRHFAGREEGRVLCSKCGIENPPGKKFCGDCAAPLLNLCPKRGIDNPTGNRSCGDCGASLGTSRASAAKQSSSPQIRVTESPAAENLEELGA